MYKKIMVPVDGSELAECVLPHVETLARSGQVKEVVFVRVVEPFHPATGGEYAFSPDELKRINTEMKTSSEDYLGRLAGRFQPQGVKVGKATLVGAVAQSLAEYATKNEADLIVISTHGRSGISRWVWGGVADRLLRSACVPVLMVRAPGCLPNF